MPTLNLQVNASAGDARQVGGAENAGRAYTGSGAVSITSNPLDPGSNAASDERSIGLRFTNVTIPQATAISSATFRLTPSGTYNAAPDTIRYHVSAQAADNAPALAATNGDLNTTNRPRTAADAGPWTQTSVTIDVEQTIDVTAVIQEIINRAGWVSGNALVILIDTHADTTAGQWQDYFAYDGSAAKAAKLDITYSAAGTSSTRRNANALLMSRRARIRRGR